MKIEQSLGVSGARARSRAASPYPALLSFAHLFSFSRVNLIYARLPRRWGRIRAAPPYPPRENVIWIQSCDESNRNSAERTRHRLEIRFEFAGGDGRRSGGGEVAMGLGGKREQR